MTIHKPHIAKAVVRGISTTDGGIKKFSTDVMPDEVLEGISTAQSAAESAQSAAESAQSAAESAQSTASTAKTTAETAQTTAESAQSTASTAKATAEAAVKPHPTVTGDNEKCSYTLYNPYKKGAETRMYLGSIGGNALGIYVNTNNPSVKFMPPANGSSQADFEFSRVGRSYNHPLITGIGGIVMQSNVSGSTKKFKITVDDTGTISATEVTT